MKLLYGERKLCVARSRVGESPVLSLYQPTFTYDRVGPKSCATFLSAQARTCLSTSYIYSRSFVFIPSATSHRVNLSYDFYVISVPDACHRRKPATRSNRL
jgi:hypothetical protein